jgi:hypothetical protein
MSSATSSGDDTGQEIVKGIQKLDAIEADIDTQFRGLTDEPNRRQKHLLDDLNRLVDSLRGPEELLDRGNYSRPFPPRNNTYSTQQQRKDSY